MDRSGINYYRCVQVRIYKAHMEVDEDLKIKKKIISPLLQSVIWVSMEMIAKHLVLIHIMEPIAF